MRCVLHLLIFQKQGILHSNRILRQETEYEPKA